MRIKSYFADTVDEAVEKARRELGPEAMLMNTKKTELGLRALGAYEVVFAEPPEEGALTIDGQLARAAAPPAWVPPVAPSATSEAAAPATDLIRELAELRKQIETVKRSVDRRPVSSQYGGAALGPDGNEIVARLTGADMSEELAIELAAAIEQRPEDDGTLEDALRAECERRLRFSPDLPSGVGLSRAALFVGPPGTGKTTTLVKLALRFGLRNRVPLQFLSLDTLRVGGWEQLSAYARIAGIPFEPLHTPAALRQAFNEKGSPKLLLIDTPGFSPAEDSYRGKLAASLAPQREVLDVHLVLQATALPRVQRAAIEHFAVFQPTRILFTHVDEVESPGPLLETALRAGLPVSFLATGQQVPEDIEEASLARLLGPLVNRTQSPARSSAARKQRSSAERVVGAAAAGASRSRRVAPAA